MLRLRRDLNLRGKDPLLETPPFLHVLCQSPSQAITVRAEGIVTFLKSGEFSAGGGEL